MLLCLALLVGLALVLVVLVLVVLVFLFLLLVVLLLSFWLLLLSLLLFLSLFSLFLVSFVFLLSFVFFAPLGLLGFLGLLGLLGLEPDGRLLPSFCCGLGVTNVRGSLTLILMCAAGPPNAAERCVRAGRRHGGDTAGCSAVTLPQRLRGVAPPSGWRCARWEGCVGRWEP